MDIHNMTNEEIDAVRAYCDRNADMGVKKLAGCVMVEFCVTMHDAMALVLTSAITCGIMAACRQYRAKMN